MEKTGFFETEEIKKRRLAFLKERKCQIPGCYNYSYSGYIYCVGHVHDFPHKMHPDDIKLLMEDEANGNNKEKGTH